MPPEPITIWAWWILALLSWNMCVALGKKKTWWYKLSHSGYRGSQLHFWTHTIGEPRSDLLMQPQIMTLLQQACIGTRHAGCITSSAIFLMLMLLPLWNSLNLDWDKMTFSHCCRFQSSCFPANWTLFSWLFSVISVSLQAAQLFSLNAWILSILCI